MRVVHVPMSSVDCCPFEIQGRRVRYMIETYNRICNIRSSFSKVRCISIKIVKIEFPTGSIDSLLNLVLLKRERLCAVYRDVSRVVPDLRTCSRKETIMMSLQKRFITMISTVSNLKSLRLAIAQTIRHTCMIFK